MLRNSTCAHARLHAQAHLVSDVDVASRAVEGVLLMSGQINHLKVVHGVECVGLPAHKACALIVSNASMAHELAVLLIVPSDRPEHIILLEELAHPLIFGGTVAVWGEVIIGPRS